MDYSILFVIPTDGFGGRFICTALSIETLFTAHAKDAGPTPRGWQQKQLGLSSAPIHANWRQR